MNEGQCHRGIVQTIEELYSTCLDIRRIYIHFLPHFYASKRFRYSKRLIQSVRRHGWVGGRVKGLKGVMGTGSVMRCRYGVAVREGYKGRRGCGGCGVDEGLRKG